MHGAQNETNAAPSGWTDVRRMLLLNQFHLALNMPPTLKHCIQGWADCQWVMPTVERNSEHLLFLTVMLFKQPNPLYLTRRSVRLNHSATFCCCSLDWRLVRGNKKDTKMNLFGCLPRLTLRSHVSSKEVDVSRTRHSLGEKSHQAFSPSPWQTEGPVFARWTLVEDCLFFPLQFLS